MAGFDLGEGVRTIFLAGIGAIATGAEMSQQIVEDLVKKGELTVEQGKVLNEELTRKATKMATDTHETLLRTRLECMSAEEREAYAKKVNELAKEINDRAATVEVEVEEAEEPEDKDTTEGDAAAKDDSE